jgi:hypothetical protein
VTLLTRLRPHFFSTYEWGYHWAVTPLLFPLGNYYFIGPRYFRDPVVFAVGTAVVFGLYWFSVVTLTLAVRWVIRQNPGLRQSVRRLGLMFGTVGALTVVLAVFDVWVYSLVPATGVRFSWAAVRPIWVLGLGFDVLLCAALSLFYTYAQWQQDQSEAEQLERRALQRQYNQLKTQLKPHFLFNSLNSVSVLIHENPAQAERFVDQMARVYRYLLQAGRKAEAAGTDAATEAPDRVPIQAELDFLASYASLQQVRYGAALAVEAPGPLDPALSARGVPPLTLLTLLDYAVQHSVLTTEQPLTVRLTVTPDARLLVTYPHQPKKLRVDPGQNELNTLLANYRLLTAEPVEWTVTDGQVWVRLPLLSV